MKRIAITIIFPTGAPFASTSFPTDKRGLQNAAVAMGELARDFRGAAIWFGTEGGTMVRYVPAAPEMADRALARLAAGMLWAEYPAA